MARSRPRERWQPEDRRRHLAQAAGRVISREGLDRATTRRIAEEADTAHGLLHYMFPNKESLVNAAYQHWVDADSQMLDELVPTGCGLETAVRNVVFGFWDRIIGDIPVLTAQYELFFWALRSEEAGDFPPSVYDRYIGVIRDALIRATDGTYDRQVLEDLARFINIFTDGVFLQYLAYRDEDASRVELERGIRMALLEFDRPA